MKTFRIFLFLVLSFLCLQGKSQNWEQWGSGTDIIYTGNFLVDSSNNTLYASGKFINVFGDTIKGLAKWNGTGWDDIGYPSLNCRGIVIYKGKLCAADDNSLYVYSWDGISWDTLGVQFDLFYIKDMVEYKNALYAVGFNSNGIAKWNDTVWTYIPAMTIITEMKTALVYKDELCIGGFWEADSNRTGVMRWDGINWKSLGNGIISGVNDCDISFGGVKDLKVYKNDLFVAGCFIKIHGNPDNCIAKWDGSSWSGVGGGLSGSGFVWALEVFNGELYACGEFITAGGIPAYGIAKWDGTKWCGLGSTFYGDIRSMTVFNNELIIGGSFNYMDGYPTKYIAKWIGGSYVDTCGNISAVAELTNEENNIVVFPNPIISNKININFPFVSKGDYDVLNVLGAIVKKGKINNTDKLQLDIGDFAKGCYFVKIQGMDKNYYGKFIKN